MYWRAPFQRKKRSLDPQFILKKLLRSTCSRPLFWNIMKIITKWMNSICQNQDQEKRATFMRRRQIIERVQFSFIVINDYETYLYFLASFLWQDCLSFNWGMNNQDKCNTYTSYIKVKLEHYLLFMISPPKISSAVLGIKYICLHLFMVFYLIQPSAPQ